MVLSDPTNRKLQSSRASITGNSRSTSGLLLRRPFSYWCRPALPNLSASAERRRCAFLDRGKRSWNRQRLALAVHLARSLRNYHQQCFCRRQLVKDL